MGRKSYLSFGEKAGLAGCLTMIVVAVLSVCGYLKHIFWCFENQEWLLLFVGAIAFPIGILHGWWLWFQ